ncbi:MAG: type II toxin-antitoxin system ParD family antitoxin [Terracidiphilus sp.]|jgi:putative addiction module CopG family antidote
MIYRKVHLTLDSYDFVRSRVESGRYESAAELVRAALRALHREEAAQSKQKPASIADSDVFRKLWEISQSSHTQP